MPVRRVSENRYFGYGSFGQLVTQSADLTFTDIRGEASNAIQFRPNADSPTNPIAYIFTQMSWRWKFSLGRFDADMIQLFNARTSKRRLGTVITEHLGYIVAEEYVFYPNQMSSQRYMVAKFSAADDYKRNDEIPCDEPPSDAEIAVVQDAYWANSSWLPSIGAYPVSASQNDVMLGDKVSFYPEKGVQGYLFGGGYNYQHIRILQSTVANTSEPPLINQ